MKNLNLVNISKKIATASSTLLLAFAVNAFAAGPELNVNKNDVAISGYDPVAYHVQKSPVKGKAKYTAAHNGAIYHFSSESNRDRFKSNPGKYAPAYGGYCAMGVALEKKFDVDPQAWKIVNGTLYLNLNKDVQKKWAEDIPGFIENANDNWKEIKFTTADELAAR